MRSPLTERQYQALKFIRTYIRDFRKPPTLKEIGDALNIRSSNGVFKLVKTLEKKGYVNRDQHTARGLRLIDTDDPFDTDDSIPLLKVVSRTASDQPEQLHHRPTTHFSVDPYFLRTVGHVEACLIGRASDDGMNGDGVRKGDFLIIEEMSWQELENGDLAAFLVREELLARHFFLANERIHLRPADRTYTEETYSYDDPGCYVIGRIAGVMRRL